MKTRFLIVSLFVFAVSLFNGCDHAYEYIVFPPERIEYTLVPDPKLNALNNDARYKISDDKQTISFDATEYKVEIKYMTDYQLNTFEFPEQSQSGQFSTNPFTYGNWIDPDLGYTPNRFTVFKVTIYNYAGGKINFDPENCVIRTDRGDVLNCYGREEKNSRFQSLEAYFKKRKGTSGIDDDVFESRMGIIRRTVHYLGKPIFKGDVRDGLIVFDPLVDEVEHVKLTLKDFILGYDENNQPSEFTTMNFYFTRNEFVPPKKNGQSIAGRDSTKQPAIAPLAAEAKPAGTLKILVKATNVAPVNKLMKPLEEYLNEYTNFKTTFEKTSFQPAEFTKANVLMILAEDEEMNFLQEQEKVTAEFLRNGGFIVADVFATSTQNNNWGNINNFLTNIGALLGNKFDIRRIPSTHLLYTVWKRFDALPQIDSDLFNRQEKQGGSNKERTFDYLMGVYFENKLVGVLSNRGYSIAWGEFFSPEYRVGKDYTRQRDLLANILYYAHESSKKTNTK